MKIKIDENSLIETKISLDKRVSLVFKTHQKEKTIIISAELSAEQIDELVTDLISLRSLLE